MRVVIWGLGYVGTVSAACLAEMGHDVTGVEPNRAKVDALNAGDTVLREPGLTALVRKGVLGRRLRATDDGPSAVAGADVSLVCVGTPSSADGSPVLDYVRSVTCEIGRSLRGASHFHVVVLRSTLFPGTARNIVAPILEKHSGLRAGEEFGLAANPEFMREASAIEDFYSPPYTVVGQLNARSGDLVQSLYEGLNAPFYRVSLEEAELVKLANNAFHALKTGFANEIGRICDRLGTDSHAVMGLVCADTKLNISPAYLRPGFAFGGSCLPKDLRSLTFHGRRLGVELPILESIIPSNRLQIEAARIKIHDLRARNVGILGLSFKMGTDDLRESAMIALIRALWQDGINVRVYDPDVEIEKTFGSNLEYLERQLPQIRTIMCSDLAAVLADADAVVVRQRREEFIAGIQGCDRRCAVLDLVRLEKGRRVEGASRYRGISW